MPSLSLQQWLTVRTAALDEIEGAHRHIGGTGPGRRYATQQINQAYLVLLASQFQGFCRNLHNECIDHLARAMPSGELERTVYEEFRLHRRLGTGNPNPGNIGADYNRLGLVFWDVVDADHTRNRDRRAALDALILWRNAIAHQDFDPTRLGGRTTVQLHEVRAWRSACDGLARSFDRVMGTYLHGVTGIAPW
ncbi:MAG TPA: hypothetical protein VGF55_29975 [Gemmataceae bacterium]|jgi:hypothetical protein